MVPLCVNAACVCVPAPFNVPDEYVVVPDTVSVVTAPIVPPLTFRLTTLTAKPLGLNVPAVTVRSLDSVNALVVTWNVPPDPFTMNGNGCVVPPDVIVFVPDVAANVNALEPELNVPAV